MTTPTAFQDTIESVITTIENQFKNKASDTYVKFGISNLDQDLLGFAPGELTTINANNPEDLLSFTQKCLVDVVTKQDKSALVYSGNIPTEHYTKRILARLSQIDLLKLDRAAIEPSEWPALADTTTLLNKAKLWFADGLPNIKGLSDHLHESYAGMSAAPDLVLVHTTERELMGREQFDFLQLKQTAQKLGCTVWIAVELRASMGLVLDKKRPRPDSIPSGLENHGVDKILFIAPQDRDQSQDRDRDQRFHNNSVRVLKGGLAQRVR